MASPATPSSQKTTIPPGTNSPGSWQHPRLAEINRRQRATSFDETKRRVLFYSVVILFLSYYIPGYLQLGHYISLSTTNQWLATWAFRLFRLTVTYNGYQALRPLLPWSKIDDLSDIPLTPRQRSLFGLPATSTPATPGSVGTHTPPRYQRSTPRAVSATSSRIATAGSSPYGQSGSGSPLSGSPIRSGGLGSGGSFSGSPANGLVRRATTGGNSKRGSLGSSTSRLLEMEDSVFGAPLTPTPSGGQRGVSVALNNKWLYKRQHGSPGGSTKYI